MKKCIRCQVVISKKLRPGGARRPPRPAAPRCGPLRPPAAPPAVHGPAPCRGSHLCSGSLERPQPRAPAPDLDLFRRRHGGGQRSPRARPTAAVGGGAAEPLQADGGAHHLSDLHRQPHPPRVPVRPRRVRALWRGAQRLPDLPPAHPRPHPDLRVAGAPRLVPGPCPAAALTSPFSVFYKKIAGLCAWLPVWGGAVRVPHR